MKKVLALLALVAIGAIAWWLWRPAASPAPDITVRVQQQAPVDADALSAKLIPNEDLPPAGTRSLFDHVIAQNQSLPYPFDKLISVLQKLDPSGTPPLTLLIPQGRSLLKTQADYAHPRVLAAADFQAPATPAALGLSARGQLFLGFVENAHEIEVLSYNQAAGRYEFQLVQNYCDGCVPRIVYARRVICLSCHQGAAPIFPQRPWNETNGQPDTAAKIVAARGDQPYLSVPAAVPLSAPERFEQLVDVADFIPVTQRLWLDACGAGEGGNACRRLMLKLALAYLWDPGEFDSQSADARKLRELQAAHWPAAGIAVADSDLPNRDPLGEGRGFRGYLHTLFTRQPRPGEGARNNEDLAAFEKLPKLPARLDPLSQRAPKRMLHADDLDGVFGVAALITEGDFKMLETAAGSDLSRLLATADHADDALFAPAPFVRVKVVNALRAALGSPKALDYCCLSTADMSPPVASGVPPLQISAGSVLLEFQQYCFACHRGNPSQKLDFMGAANEAAVLESIKNKSEIRDALDWTRYRDTDHSTKLMPPAGSQQRAALEAAVQQNPKLLDKMRDTVPSLF